MDTNTPPKRPGRPRIHTDQAARVAAFRAQHRRLEIRLENAQADNLQAIAASLDVPLTVLVESMLKFALANRDWKRMGLAHTRPETK